MSEKIKCPLSGAGPFNLWDPYDPTLFGGKGAWGDGVHTNEDFDPPCDAYPCPECGQELDIMSTTIIPEHDRKWVLQ